MTLGDSLALNPLLVTLESVEKYTKATLVLVVILSVLLSLVTFPDDLFSCFDRNIIFGVDP